MPFVLPAAATAIAAAGTAATAITVGTVLKAVATFALKTLLMSGVSHLATQLLTPKQKQAQRQASVTTLSLGEQPREVIFGRAQTGGTLLWGWNYGGKQKTDNEVVVLAVADHICDALEGFWVDDQYYAFAGDGAQPNFVWNGDPKLHVYWRNGTATQTFPAHLMAGGGFTANDLKGVAYVVFDYKFNAKGQVFSGRPSFKMLVRGKRLYNPALDSTVPGGSGPQRWNDPATWVWSENAYLCRYNYARGIYALDQVDEPEHLLIGRGLSAVEAPPERAIPSIAICAEAVPLKAGGTEPRYRVGGVVRADESFISVEEMFAASMAGEIVQPEGTVDIAPGVAQAVVATITDADLVEGEPVQKSDFRPGPQRTNSIIPSYIEPAQNWQDHAAPVRRLVSDIIEDRGAHEETLDLSLVTSGTQAQRCGEIRRRRVRREKTRTITLPPWFSHLEEGDWINWTSERFSRGATVTWRIRRHVLTAGRRITLQLEEIAASDYSWTAAADEVTPGTPPPPEPERPGPLELDEVSVEPISKGGVPGVRFHWETPVDEAITSIRAEVRMVGQAEVTPTVTQDINAGVLDVTGGVGGAEAMQARLIPQGSLERVWQPTAWLPVTPPQLEAGTAQEVPWSGVQDDGGRPQDGADVTGENTANDTANVGGRPSAEVLEEIDALIETYGETASAAASAAAAAAAAALAETAKENAEAAFTAADAARDDAVAQATAAAGSASAAAGSATVSTNKADEAAGSASSALAQANIATTKAGEAAGSASAASTSATGAASSSTAAGNSASAANTAKLAAETAETNAAASASASAISASAASASQTAAGTSASTATTQAGIATTKAGEASTSAGSAAASASGAAGSASSAASYSTIAASARDAAALTAALLLPSTFQQDSLFWTSSIAGSPTVVADMVGGTFQNEAEGRTYRRPTDAAPVATKGVFTPVANRTYRASIDLRLLTSPTTGAPDLRVLIDFIALNGSYVFTGDAAYAVPLLLAANGRHTLTVDYTAPSSPPAFVRLYVNPNYNGAAGVNGLVEYYSVRVTDVTEAVAAAGSASAAATAASNASASESAAGGYASSASASANTASVQAGNASTDAASASSSSATASSAAASAASSASVAASVGTRSMLKNSNFNDYPTTSGLPAHWSDWTGGAASTRVAADVTPYAVRMSDGGGSNVGIRQLTAPGTVAAGQWVVIEAEVKLIAGSLTGAGVLLINFDAASAQVGSDSVSFSYTPDSSGAAVGAGTVGRVYRYALLTQLAGSGTSFLQLYAMTHYAAFGSIAGQITLDWRQCSVRPATDQEIASQQASAGLAALGATVSTQAIVIADHTSKLAIARYVLEAAASGGRPARLGLYSDSHGGSAIALNAAQIWFGENTVFDDATDTLRTVNGTTARVLAWGTPFGASGDLWEWVGASSVAMSAMTKANADYFVSPTSPRVGGNGFGGSGSKSGYQTTMVGVSNTSAAKTTVATVTLPGVLAGGLYKINGSISGSGGSWGEDSRDFAFDIIETDGGGGTTVLHAGTVYAETVDDGGGGGGTVFQMEITSGGEGDSISQILRPNSYTTGSSIRLRMWRTSVATGTLSGAFNLVVEWFPA